MTGPMRLPAVTLLVLLSASAAAIAGDRELSPAAASAQATATVTTAAPVFLRPDATRTPLRTLEVGTVLAVGEIQGDWLQVTFNDPQWGARTGWIQRQFVTVRAPQPPPPPVDRSPQPEPAAREGQARTATQPIRATHGPPGVRGFVGLAWDKMAATESFMAITGSDAVGSFGGGVQLTNLWRGLFAEVSVERSSVDGERVFVSGSDVFPLGIPLKITMTPLDVIGGWRGVALDRFTPYVGAGMTFVWYKETSDFADADENVDERFRGVVALGGVEIGVWKWVHVRGDVRYRWVDDALGIGGVSAQFDETNLGGFGGSLKVVVGR